MVKFRIPKAKPDTQASICEYMAIHDKTLSCDINPLEEICELATLGKISKDGNSFTPSKKLAKGIYISLYRCPKLKQPQN